LEANSRRKRCSTPQKQPAATVARAAPSGTERGVAVLLAFRPRLVEELKGRTRREMNEGMVKAMRVGVGG
jgi:hypothetical protein